MLDIFFYILLLFNILFLGISLFNWLTAPRIKNSNIKLNDEPFVSVLIPARNEERNIPNLLNSLSSQNYQNLEIIVLDDNSNDNTATIVNKFSDVTKSRLLSGVLLPETWLGKNWACNQLSNEAKGEYLLFIDADVILDSSAISNAIRYMQEYNLDMLSSFSTQQISGFGSWLTIPLVNWLLLNFLPLKFVLWFKNPSFAAANGQFILFKTETYKQIGGHAAVKDQVVEDMAFAKILKRKGYKIITTLGDNTVFCKMYSGFNEGVNGFAKNFFPGFEIPAMLFYMLLLFFAVTFLAPFVMALLSYKFILITAIILLARIFQSLPSKQNIVINTLLHPLQIIVMLYIGVLSVNRLNNNRIEWKGRNITKNN